MKVYLALIALALFAAVSAAQQTGCSAYSACDTCAAQADCQWCRSTTTCQPLSYGEEYCSGGDWVLTAAGCTETSDCGAINSCQSCAGNPNCKWCISDGTCHILGTGTCANSNWAIVAANCTGTIQTPTPIRTPAPLRTPTPVVTPTPVRTPVSTPTPAPKPILPCLPGFALVAGVGVLAFAVRKGI